MLRLLERDGTLPDLQTFRDKTEQEWMKVEATQVDTTFLSPEEVAAYVLELVKERKQECFRI
ncbi:hypothetical protein DNHGIG_39600 [Collibacillus ludicampi]|uniref:Uncharacterized protein n=1 Tax=Collibacillus ludicampi TaxID=2771369 RepID=A0AAV4LKT1_9BACL|nr:hypothetical protein [Collibacillus ludicampi]GIM48411.1 hypothetical protein DNHGIG_39600 [Collibacillus ludicampi]